MRKTRSQTARTQAENAATSSSPGHQSTSSAPIAVNPFDAGKYKECEQMVQMLRVVELQKILSFLNISFAGRKTDLQSRILSFLRTNLDLLAPKVQEVYAQSVQEQSATLQYIDPTRMYSHIQLPPTVQPNPVGLVGGGPGVQVPGGQMNVVGGAPFLHTHSINSQLPIHPDVRLKKLAFYDVLGTLIKPSTLVPRNTQRVQEVPFYFTLTPQQATEIASNRDIRNSSKVEHAIQVQLRFCLVETSCDQEDCFPPNVNVKVNNKLCQLPNVIPTNRPNVEPRRPPRPVNVTSNVKLSPTVTNTIMVQWCPDYTRSYCLAVYLVKKLTSAQLLQRMKTKGVKPADYTRGLIKEKLTEDADCEIATTMLKVSLNCPLGKMKMLLPCRASTCSHLQCFDASLYLQMNERKPTWNCPVCDKPAIYDNLVIDGYFQEVLGSSLLKSDDTEIQLHQDGSWSTPGLRSEAQILDTPSKPVQKVEVISDDIELISDDAKPVKSDLSPAPDEQPTSTSNSETMQQVDLTLSDSDDDMPLAKRRPPAKQAVASSTSNGSGGGQRAYTPAQQPQQSESPEQQARRQSPEMQPVLDQQLQQLQQQQHEQPAAAAVHASLLESLAAAVADQKHFQLLDLAAVAAAAAATASSGQSQNAGP
ncbi:E3 SUMO-protein ligase PIAS2 isoform X1 [Drosophila takahashii]|uniref:E3 SUMO-protein ligase PIAS2 isoform X1 n=2 Tax=Drosophila takahashii TaxID=29030 RepID=UPI0007E6BF42|nr:E3 SUMO-protein ligase PIAS2 isoform X1 [Drosophila takahashii]